MQSWESDRCRYQSKWLHKITLNLKGRITEPMAGLNFNKIGFAKEENLLLLVCREAVDSNWDKLETSHTVILPPKLSVLLFSNY